LVYGFIVQGIDMAAHLGGLVGGFVCGFVLTPSPTFVGHSRRQGRSVLVGVMGLGLIIGLTESLPPVEDVRARLQQFASVEATSLATLHRAMTQLQQGNITKTEVARIIEQEVLPPWRVQRDALHRLTTLSRLPVEEKRQVATVVEYITIRQEEWELLQEWLQKNDPRALKSAEEKQRKANELLRQSGAAGKKQGA
jgi:rhomboid protease GluP